MNIILFNPSLRNYLIFNEVLEQHPKLFDYVIEMSSRPHSSTFKKMYPQIDSFKKYKDPKISSLFYKRVIK